MPSFCRVSSLIGPFLPVQYFVAHGFCGLISVNVLTFLMFMKGSFSCARQCNQNGVDDWRPGYESWCYQFLSACKELGRPRFIASSINKISPHLPCPWRGLLWRSPMEGRGQEWLPTVKHAVLGHIRNLSMLF